MSYTFVALVVCLAGGLAEAVPAPVLAKSSGVFDKPEGQDQPVVDFKAAADLKGRIGVIWSTVEKGPEPNTASFLFSILSDVGVETTSYIHRDGSYWSSMGQVNGEIAFSAGSWWLVLFVNNDLAWFRFSEKGLLLSGGKIDARETVAVLAIRPVPSGCEALWSLRYYGTYDLPDFMGGRGSLRIDRCRITESGPEQPRSMYGKSLGSAVLHDLWLEPAGDRWDLYWMQGLREEEEGRRLSELHYLPDVVRTKDRRRQVVSRIAEPVRVFPMTLRASEPHVVWACEYDTRWTSRDWDGRTWARIMETHLRKGAWTKPRMLVNSDKSSARSSFSLTVADQEKALVGWQCDGKLAYVTGNGDDWSRIVQTQLRVGPTQGDDYLGAANQIVHFKGNDYILLTKMDQKLHWYRVRFDPSSRLFSLVE